MWNHGKINENIMLTNEYLIDKIAHCYLYYVKTISFPAEIPQNLMTINLDGQFGICYILKSTAKERQSMCVWNTSPNLAHRYI